LLCLSGALGLLRDTGLCVLLPLTDLRSPVRGLLAGARARGLAGVAGTGVRDASA